MLQDPGKICGASLTVRSHATRTRRCHTITALPQAKIGQETRTAGGVDLRGARQGAGLFHEG